MGFYEEHPIMTPYVSKNMICVYCRKCGSGECSWDKELKPVEGWLAKVTKKYNYYTHEAEPYSWAILDCPEYEEDERNVAKLKSKEDYFGTFKAI